MTEMAVNNQVVVIMDNVFIILLVVSNSLALVRRTRGSMTELIESGSTGVLLQIYTRLSDKSIPNINS